MKAYAEVAVAFATALVQGDFVRANALLAPALRTQFPPDALREEFYGMFRGYSDSEPKSVQFDEQFQMEAWPARRAGDVGWAYVGIHVTTLSKLSP